MSLIFLDIDGVLNSTDSIMLSPGNPQHEVLSLVPPLSYQAQCAVKHADPLAVGLLNKLLSESGAQLVLTSSHRTEFSDVYQYGSTRHLQALQILLVAMGVRVPDDFFSVTTSCDQSRDKQIDGFINLAWENGIDVENYVILDDMQLQHTHAVKCNPALGFTSKEYYKACEFLKVNTSSILLA